MTRQYPNAEIGGVYRVYSRNLRIAVCVDGEHFIGIREKLGSHRLDTEGFNGPGMIRLGYYDEPKDPAQPFKREWVPFEEPIGRIVGIPLQEPGDPSSVCGNCGMRAWWVDKPPYYSECEGGCAEARSYYNSNKPLFEALKQYEIEIYGGLN